MTDDRRQFPWARYQRAKLLDLRFCDLGVTLEGTWLEAMVAQVLRELRDRGLRVRPHFWLSQEWFSPDGVPGVAIPFYLAHPRLMRLENAQMLEIEGGSRAECLRVLRHEVGHAVQNAYELHRRRKWQRHFGLSSEPYPDFYRPDPASKDYVQHLDRWYAQAHPAEDFAETFATWLKPRSDWKRRYAGWPALEKLKYVDQLMSELRTTPVKQRSRAQPDKLSGLKRTLREHYEARRKHYAVGFSRDYDDDLQKVFSLATPGERALTAAVFIQRNRREIRQLVAKWTGGYELTLSHLLKDLIGRCRELGLVAKAPKHELMLNFAVMLTVHTARYVYGGGEWHPV
jgi:hypothetical protein